MSTDRYRELAEGAWRWVLDHVRHDGYGPWIPLAIDDKEPSWDRDGTHSGIGGLALGLAAVARVRPWAEEEAALAAAVVDRLRAVTPTTTDVTAFDGLVSHVEALTALGGSGVDAGVGAGVDAVVERLFELAPDGWPEINDITLGT